MRLNLWLKLARIQSSLSELEWRARQLRISGEWHPPLRDCLGRYYNLLSGSLGDTSTELGGGFRLQGGRAKGLSGSDLNSISNCCHGDNYAAGASSGLRLGQCCRRLLLQELAPLAAFYDACHKCRQQGAQARCHRAPQNTAHDTLASPMDPCLRAVTLRSIMSKQARSSEKGSMTCSRILRRAIAFSVDCNTKPPVISAFTGVRGRLKSFYTAQQVLAHVETACKCKNGILTCRLSKSQQHTLT